CWFESPDAILRFARATKTPDTAASSSNAKSSCHAFWNSSRASTPTPNKPPSSRIALLAPARIDPRPPRLLSDVLRIRERPDVGGVRARPKERLAGRLNADEPSATHAGSLEDDK